MCNPLCETLLNLRNTNEKLLSQGAVLFLENQNLKDRARADRDTIDDYRRTIDRINLQHMRDTEGMQSTIKNILCSLETGGF